MDRSLPLPRTSRDVQKSGVVLRRPYGGGEACANGPRATVCCRDPKKGRTVHRDPYAECRERLRARRDTDVGR